jgi:predicted regulator of Ras-like GTPase activity (Roadblock/LC7/MglB family)
MEEVQTIVRDIMRNVPEVVGAVLIDSDGIPIAWDGRFDLAPNDLGAILAASYTCYSALGADLGQMTTKSIMVEYDDLKLVHYQMPRGSLVLVAERDAPLGVIRMEAKRSIRVLTKCMKSTAEARERLMESLKFRHQKPLDEHAGESSNLISMLEKKAMTADEYH